MSPSSLRELGFVTSAPAEPDTLAERLWSELDASDLDCICKDTAKRILEGAGREVDRDRRARSLADARKMRDAIALVLPLLGELDDLMPDEPDRSAFREIAGLFRDVADLAACGADAVTRAGGQEDA